MSLHVDVKKKLDKFSLDVNFDIGKEKLGILGASGSGKSMTLKIIAGLVSPDHGNIRLDNKDIYNHKTKTNLAPQKRKICYLFQNYALFPNMTIEENITCSLAETKKHQRKQIIDELIIKFSLEKIRRHYPAQISGGQQQRTAIARALACKPQVLLLDEPFSALDDFLREKLQLDLIETLDNFAGSVIIVSHNRDEIYRLCSKTITLDKGNILEFTETESLFESPKRLESARLTGCKNFSAAKKIGENSIFAIDWNKELHTSLAVPKDITHIGVRARAFSQTANLNIPKENFINVKLKNQTQTPFEHNALYTSGGSEALWWIFNKKEQFETNIKKLYIHPKDILLLRE